MAIGKPGRAVASVLVVAMLAGCATTRPQYGNSQASAQNGNSQASGGNDGKDPCSVGGTALAGALIGALIGGAINGRDGALAGGMVGGAAGALGCMAVNVHSRQTKAASQVNREYVQSRGALPQEPQVVVYSPQLSVGTIQRGVPFKVTSVVELVDGASQPVREVREEIVVYTPQGEPFKNGSKPLVSKGGSGGRFENTFEVTLPTNVSQGVYNLRTNLYVNGKLMTSRDMRTQLVWNGKEGVLLAGL